MAHSIYVCLSVARDAAAYARTSLVSVDRFSQPESLASPLFPTSPICNGIADYSMLKVGMRRDL